MDKHGDPFRTATVEFDTKSETAPKVPRMGAKTPAPAKPAEKQNTATGGKKAGSKRKSKADKVLFTFFTAFKLRFIESLV